MDRKTVCEKILNSANDKVSNKRVHNTDIFTNSDNELNLEIDEIVNQIYDIKISSIPGATDIGLENFRKELGLIGKWNNKSHISTRQYHVFANNMASEAIRKATLNFYEKQYLDNGIIPMNLDIREFNISKSTINKILSNKKDLKEPVRLLDIINLKKEEVDKWYKCGDAVIRELFDIIDIYIINTKTITTDKKVKLLNYKELLEDLKELQNEYNNIQNSKKTLEYQEKEIEKQMKLIRKEINSFQK